MLDEARLKMKRVKMRDVSSALNIFFCLPGLAPEVPSLLRGVL